MSREFKITITGISLAFIIMCLITIKLMPFIKIVAYNFNTLNR